MIYQRKSCRSYTGTPVAENMLETIRAIELKPLAHLYVANKDTFRFCKVQTPPEAKGCHYIGSFTL